MLIVRWYLTSIQSLLLASTHSPSICIACCCRQKLGWHNPNTSVFLYLQAHRDGCMCIICKQARRVGRAWGGMSGMAGAPKWQAPMLTAGRRGQPVPRFGKRAFLHALPHLVCGPLQHKVGLSCCHLLYTGGRPPPHPPSAPRSFSIASNFLASWCFSYIP